MMLFDEYHRWKVIIFFSRSSACFPSNYGMSKASFVGMGIHVGLWAMGSFVNLVKSGKFNEAKKGDWEFVAIAPCQNTVFWLGIGFVCDVPCCEFTWILEWVALLCPLGVVGGLVCGDPVGVFIGVALGDQRGFPTNDAPIKDEPIRVAVFHLWRLNGERPEPILVMGGGLKGF